MMGTTVVLSGLLCEFCELIFADQIHITKSMKFMHCEKYCVHYVDIAIFVIVL